MKRRRLIAQGTTLLTTGISGCLNSPTPDKTDADDTETTATEQNSNGDSTATNTSGGRTEIKIESSLDKELQIELQISRERSTIHAELTTVPPNQSVVADYAITETGIYDVAIESDAGLEGSTRVHVDEYALNHGRKIVIAISSEMIHGFIQE